MHEVILFTLYIQRPKGNVLKLDQFVKLDQVPK